MTEFSSLQSSAVIFPLGELPVEAHFSTYIVCRKKKKNYVTDPEVGLQIEHQVQISLSKTHLSILTADPCWPAACLPGDRGEKAQ